MWRLQNLNTAWTVYQAIMNLRVLDEVTDIHAKSFFDSIFYLFLQSRTIADGAAAGLIAFITKASAFSFFKSRTPWHHADSLWNEHGGKKQQIFRTVENTLV